jgi:hypothetical protein
MDGYLVMTSHIMTLRPLDGSAKCMYGLIRDAAPVFSGMGVSIKMRRLNGCNL